MKRREDVFGPIQQYHNKHGKTQKRVQPNPAVPQQTRKGATEYVRLSLRFQVPVVHVCSFMKFICYPALAQWSRICISKDDGPYCVLSAYIVNIYSTFFPRRFCEKSVFKIRILDLALHELRDFSDLRGYICFKNSYILTVYLVNSWSSNIEYIPILTTFS